jgi:hypothetical protein
MLLCCHHVVREASDSATARPSLLYDSFYIRVWESITRQNWKSIGSYGTKVPELLRCGKMSLRISVILIYCWTTYIDSRRTHRKRIRCSAMDICEPHRKHLFLCCIYSSLHKRKLSDCFLRIRCCGNVFTESLPSNESTCQNIIRSSALMSFKRSFPSDISIRLHLPLSYKQASERRVMPIWSSVQGQAIYT